jgi:hypothetical protein
MPLLGPMTLLLLIASLGLLGQTDQLLDVIWPSLPS